MSVKSKEPATVINVSVINVLEQEMKFYKDIKNPDWSIDKNSGFKLGIEYCKDLLESIKGEND